MPIAGHLIDNGCQLTGVDSAPALLARAAARFPDTPGSPPTCAACPAPDRSTA
ncbi:hypothetical protein WJ969_06620 [Achromobacter xylosoxidans]